MEARVVTLWPALGRRPNVSIPAAGGGRAEMRAADRFFDQDQVTVAKVRAPPLQSKCGPRR